MTPDKVLKFWFKECSPEQWFKKKSAKFDALIRRRFLKTYWAVVRGETGLGPRRKAGARRREEGPRNSRAREYAWETSDWRKTPRGRLAEIIVLDQFSRNMFRGKPQAFLYDPLALALAQEVVRRGDDRKLSKIERRFLYLPFEHSESKKMHREAVRVFKSLGDKEALWYERDHKKVIDRFGRYPSRNKILGRKSTVAEKKFLQTHKGW